MPELPEVETTLRGIKSSVLNQTITHVIVRHRGLRWPIPTGLEKTLQNQTVRQLSRRGKYLLLTFDHGTLILHLGMSGRLRILSDAIPPQKHDHVDIHFSNKKYLRYTDPRRFGAILWTDEPINNHPLLVKLGPEPLLNAFDADYLFKKSRHKKVSIKSFIMTNEIVVGVGNIYATESLFQARIHPNKPAGEVALADYKKLVTAIKKILRQAIEKGGTTLKDFTQSDGKPGYFSIQLKVYGNAGKPCPRCKTTLSTCRIGQRASVYCEKCQMIN
jgi:formamidopyrimidine-DNA glycosylase